MFCHEVVSFLFYGPFRTLRKRNARAFVSRTVTTCRFNGDQYQKLVSHSREAKASSGVLVGWDGMGQSRTILSRNDFWGWWDRRVNGGWDVTAVRVRGRDVLAFSHHTCCKLA
jgi:hypothetical protein